MKIKQKKKTCLKKIKIKYNMRLFQIWDKRGSNETLITIEGNDSGTRVRL